MPIRSFVRRKGRMSERQISAIESQWSIYGIDLTEGMLDFTACFSGDAKVVLEIGFGMGTSLFEMARLDPEHQYLGIDVHEPGIGALLAALKDSPLPNLKVCRGDAIILLREKIADHSLERVQLFFPDPWPRIRHRKRRIFNAEFLDLMVKKLSPTGLLYAVTDDDHYALSMQRMANHHAHLHLLAGDDPRGLALRAQRPLTKYEARAQRLGHTVHEWVIART